MKIDIAFPGHHIHFDGIGDYSRKMAAALHAQGHDVRLLSARRGEIRPDLPNLDVWDTGSIDAGRLVRAVAERAPDILIVHFEQFTYGKHGWNPSFPRVFRGLRRAGWKGTGVLLVHETYATHRTLRGRLMHAYQRHQIERLARDADKVVFVRELWQRWLGGLVRDQRVITVPSNIALIPCSRAEARDALGLGPGAVGILLFGVVGDAILLESLASTVRSHPGATVLYVGKYGDEASSALDGVAVTDLGPLPEDEVSRVMQAADVGVVVPSDGLSGKRGSFAAMALHGLPIVASVSDDTDSHFVEAARRGEIALVDSPDSLRVTMDTLLADPQARELMARRLRAGSLPRGPEDNARELIEFAAG